MKSNEIDRLREKIDQLDRSIVDLISQRTAVAEEIGQIKKRQDLPIFRPDRHGAVYDRVADSVPEAMASGIRYIYREIMSLGMAVEGDLVFLCPDALSGAAARFAFGSSVEIALADAPGILRRVSADRNAFGFVPAGEADAVFESLLDGDVLCYGEVVLRPDHRRYIILSTWNCPRSGRDKTSVAASGDLKALISCIEHAGREVLRVETFHSQKHQGPCAFLDFPGHREDPDCAVILENIKSRSDYFHFLGSYPAAAEL